MFLHFTAIADAVDLPIIIYNIPPRSVVDMSVETMARLAKHPNIVGVKDATANLARPLHTRRACGEEFCQLSGEDHTAIAFLAAGGVGCISVTGNVAPRLCSDMHTRVAGRAGAATRWRSRTGCCRCTMRCSSKPARRPVKYAASLLGHGTGKCRLPLAPMRRCDEAARSRGDDGTSACSTDGTQGFAELGRDDTSRCKLAA